MFERSSRWCAAVVGGVMIACGGGGEGGGAGGETPDATRGDSATPAPPVEKRPTPEAISGASAQATADPVRRDEPTVTTNVAALARVSVPPPDHVGGRDLTMNEEGVRRDVAFDIDGDGTAEALGVFLPKGGAAPFLFWEADGLCHLAWESYSVARYVFSACGARAAADSYVCSQAGRKPRACSHCAEGTCEACDAQITAAGAECPPYVSEPDAGVAPADAGVEPDGGEPFHIDPESDASQVLLRLSGGPEPGFDNEDVFFLSSTHGMVDEQGAYWIRTMGSGGGDQSFQIRLIEFSASPRAYECELAAAGLFFDHAERHYGAQFAGEGETCTVTVTSAAGEGPIVISGTIVATLQPLDELPGEPLQATGAFQATMDIAP